MRTALALLMAVLPALPAGAQNFEEERRQPAERTQAAQQASEASSQAEARRPVEGSGDVTYADVLARPDDVALDYRWAKKQIDSGDITGASATLERILMLRPDLTAVRLTYAVVLYRLDSLDEAQQELERVQSQAAGALAQEARDYLGRVRDAQRLTHASGLLGYGFEYDDNRNAGPSSGQVLFNGTALDLATGKATADTSQLFLARAGLARDLQGPLAKSVFGDLTYYRAEQTTLDTLNLQAYSFEAGVELRAGRWTLTPTALADHIRLHEQTYLRTRGARLRADRRLNRRVAVFGWLQSLFDDYVVTRDVPTATDRTGNETTVRGGATLTLTPAQHLTAEAGYEQKDARRIWYAYDRLSLALTHAWLLGQGRFLLTGLSLDRDRYRGPDTVISAQDRADDTTRFSLTFGQPLGFLGKPFEPLLITADYEYLQVDSNILNYAYSNNKVGGMLTYRWGL